MASGATILTMFLAETILRQNAHQSRTARRRVAKEAILAHVLISQSDHRAASPGPPPRDHCRGQRFHHCHAERRRQFPCRRGLPPGPRELYRGPPARGRCRTRATMIRQVASAARAHGRRAQHRAHHHRAHHHRAHHHRAHHHRARRRVPPEAPPGTAPPCPERGRRDRQLTARQARGHTSALASVVPCSRLTGQAGVATADRTANRV
jgi:hypothetical protein